MTVVDDRAASNRAALLERLAELDEQRGLANLGGGDKALARHRARGKLTVRERIELLLDRDSPFLELSPYAAWGTDFPVGASTVTGIGVVEGVEVLISANDPTVRGGTSNPYTLRKSQCRSVSCGDGVSRTRRWWRVDAGTGNGAPVGGDVRQDDLHAGSSVARRV
jgi:acyl-CoA carboxylase subunit beta